MLAQGTRQVESASERIKLSLDSARAGGKRVGRSPPLAPGQAEQCQRMTDEGAWLRHIARVIQYSPATVRSRWPSREAQNDETEQKLARDLGRVSGPI